MQSTSRIVSLMSIGVHVLLQSQEKTIVFGSFSQEKRFGYKAEENVLKSHAGCCFSDRGNGENEALRANSTMPMIQHSNLPPMF